MSEEESLVPINKDDFKVVVKPASIEFENGQALDKIVDDMAKRYTGLVVTTKNYKESRALKSDLSKVSKALNRYRIDKSNEAKEPIEDFKNHVDALIKKIDATSHGLDVQIKQFQETARKNRQAGLYPQYLKILDTYGVTEEQVSYNPDYNKTTWSYPRMVRDIKSRCESFVKEQEMQKEMRQTVISQAKKLAIGSEPFLDQLKTKSLSDVLTNMENYKQDLINIEKEKTERRKEYENANHKVVGNKVIDTSTSEIVDEIHTFLLKISLTKYQYDNLMRYLRDNGIEGKITKLKGNSDVQ
ncbi:DUF1351 domain-containing protein [Lactobacillus hominis]|uniref:Orf309 n=1 Tax=Lactobacillus hominis DSM 23910 = CRBIP 24.179 TaxID=1423758 RepID=I7IVK0_9LACO|nr:DUF1351 domain-containing protein [Lactobacillus hominis]KRM85870.1 hypothetical protein FC41_GL000060 [Lactobacillus hominis DSM 23910 = CRBIP 24.179]MCT3348893.1 DUF1351 domain-containing protein [Lactobacillus hominis]CCI81578.1 Orf309 [Lactobacillus hominis DSM 23910 = CRBIP 24.179]